MLDDFELRLSARFQKIVLSRGMLGTRDYVQAERGRSARVTNS